MESNILLMVKRISFYLLALLVFLPAAYTQTTTERGLFVSVLENPPVLTDRNAARQMIEFAQATGMKKLFVQIYRAGEAWFPSEVADAHPYYEIFQKTGVDPFQQLIQDAHAAGLEVHAWINLMSLSNNSAARILDEYGLEVLTRNAAEKKDVMDYLIDNQYWLEPGDLRVRSNLSKIVAEIVTLYPQLDGIQFDYIRYPDTKPAYGYAPMNLKRFQMETEIKSINEKTEAWRKWKRDQVTETVKLLAGRARQINPKIQVSTTGCASYVRAREEAFQDWGEWLNQGYVDFVTMMNYPNNLSEFKRFVDSARGHVDDFRKVYLGVGAYKFMKNAPEFQKVWNACENDFSRGCVAFYYGSVTESSAIKDVFLNRTASNS